MTAPSLQGEHVFNALNALAQRLATEMRSALPAAPSEARTAAEGAIDALIQLATQLGAARDHHEFRSADRGDAHNSDRYSQLVTATETAVAGITLGGPSQLTAGYTVLNRNLDNLNASTVDEIARASRRGSLAGGRRAPFDQWFTATDQLMYDTYRAIREAALAVARARNA
jgi:hypothetical protein